MDVYFLCSSSFLYFLFFTFYSFFFFCLSGAFFECDTHSFINSSAHRCLLPTTLSTVNTIYSVSLSLSPPRKYIRWNTHDLKIRRRFSTVRWPTHCLNDKQKRHFEWKIHYSIAPYVKHSLCSRYPQNDLVWTEFNHTISTLFLFFCSFQKCEQISVCMCVCVYIWFFRIQFV